jgi:tetrahydromethanopterin S-methyltransferase subunit A
MEYIQKFRNNLNSLEVIRIIEYDDIEKVKKIVEESIQENNSFEDIEKEVNDLMWERNDDDFYVWTCLISVTSNYFEPKIFTSHFRKVILKIDKFYVTLIGW